LFSGRSDTETATNKIAAWARLVYIHWLSMVRTGPNKHLMLTMASKPVRTHSNSIGAHPVAMRTLETPGSRRLKQSFVVEVEICALLYPRTT